MKRWVLNQGPFFYGTLAGAIIGGAIELIAQVLSDGDSCWIVKVLRLVAALVICTVGLFLLRITRDLEKIDRAVDIKRSEPGITSERVEEYEGMLKRDKGRQVFPNFLRALVLVVVALILLFTSSFPLDEYFEYIWVYFLSK